jgi:GntR family transcriptional regulator, arabinose operon transcriptional repressor
MGKPTLYQVVIDDIMERIRQGRFSFDKPITTESKLMEQYNISRITVRRALAELENKGVLVRKRGVGSFVSQSIYEQSDDGDPASSQNLFAFIFPFNISRTGMTHVFQSANSVLSEHGMYASIYITKQDGSVKGRTVLNQLASMDIAGVAYYPKTSDIHINILDRFIFEHKPVVIMDIPSNCPYISSVTSDNLNGAKQLMKHLISLGHTKIAYVSGVSATERQTVCDRIAGYVLAHEEAGMSIHRELMITDMDESRRNHIPEGSDKTELASCILSLAQQGVTAIVAEHDQLALEIMMVCHTLNINVPQDLSVCGYDDSEWAHMLPNGSITTVRQNKELIGKHVAELLIAGKGNAMKAARNIVVPTELVIGTTSGPNPGLSK